MLKLASDNHNPKQPSRFTQLAAIVARAMMTESAPASFFGDGVPDDWPPAEPEPVKCPCCLREYTDWNETEFIGWHGECVDCFFKREDNDERN